MPGNVAFNELISNITTAANIDAWAIATSIRFVQGNNPRVARSRNTRRVS